MFPQRSEGHRLGSQDDVTPPPPSRPSAPYRLTPDDLAARREVFAPAPLDRRQPSTAYRMSGEGIASQRQQTAVTPGTGVPRPGAYLTSRQAQARGRNLLVAMLFQAEAFRPVGIGMGMFYPRHARRPPMPMTYEDLVDLDPVHVGVAPETLAKATTECVVSAPITAEEPSTCVVCQAGMVAGERVRTLPCRHQYHTECIDEWLGAHKTCPVCKAEVKAAA